MTANWLHAYLVDAVTRHLCTRIGCTTCGALDFRRGVLTALASVTGQPAEKRFDEQRGLAIAHALAGVEPDADDTGDMEAAVRCLLFDLWGATPMARGEIEALLDGTWAGAVLSRMQEHHTRKNAARRAQAEMEAADARRREAQKPRTAQEQYERRERKQERDRLWRAGQGRSTDPV